MLILFLVLEVIPCGIRLIGALGWLTLPSCHDAFDFSALDALHFCSRQGGPFSKVCPLVALFWFVNLFLPVTHSLFTFLSKSAISCFGFRALDELVAPGCTTCLPSRWCGFAFLAQWSFHVSWVKSCISKQLAVTSFQTF